MTTYDDAAGLADARRVQCGDDVILHYAEDYGWGLGCDDCDWVALYDGGDPDNDGSSDQ